MTSMRWPTELGYGLGLLWWPIATSFLLTLPWRIHERLQVRAGIIRPVEPFPGMQLQPGFSWTMALVYVAAWWWLWIAYARAALAAGTILPSISEVRGSLGQGQFRMAMVLGSLLILDLLPLSFWRAILNVISR